MIPNHMRKSSLIFLSLLCFFIGISATASAVEITSLSPRKGPVGTEVTIQGTGFGASQGSSIVTFNGQISIPRSWSDSKIIAPVPQQATTGPVIVRVNGVSSNHVTFIVTPLILDLVPPEGCVGSSVSVNGLTFGSSQGTSIVTFNGIPANVTGWSSTSIRAIVPTGATTGPVVVTVRGQASNGVPFTVTCQ
jgi:hypothetical protein